MSTGRMPQPGDLIARKYQIERLLGRGGMGAVFEARHTIIDKSVALKWLRPDLSTDPEFMHRLIREARAAGRVHHPHVLAVHDVGEHEGALFLVMDYLRGISLEALIANGPLPWPEALALLLPAMRGVRAAHASGVLHRDLKPANIFLCEDDHGKPLGAKVLDFGISKIVDSRYEDGASTETGMQLGTPAYMSPEQLRGEKSADERIDVYGFGVILYRVLAGRLPFTGATSSALAINAATTEAPPLALLCPGVPANLVAVVEKAMASDRARRYAGMDALIAALEPIEASSAAGARPDAVVSALRSLHTTTSGTASIPTARRSRIPWLVWAGAGALLGAFFTYIAATHSAAHDGASSSAAPAPSPGTPADSARAPVTASTTIAPMVTPAIAPATSAETRRERPAAHSHPAHSPHEAASRPHEPSAPPATSTANASSLDRPHLNANEF